MARASGSRFSALYCISVSTLATSSWVNQPPPPETKVEWSLVKGNQWLISPDHKALFLGWVGWPATTLHHQHESSWSDNCQTPQPDEVWYDSSTQWANQHLSMFLLKLVCASTFSSWKFWPRKNRYKSGEKRHVSKLAKGYKKKQKIWCLSTPVFLVKHEL